MGGVPAETMTVALPVTPWKVALINAEPAPMAVTTPFASTRATVGLLLVQFVAILVTGTPDTLAKLANAAALCGLPATMFVVRATLTLESAPGFWITVFGPVA